MLNKYKNLALPLMAVVSGILLGAIVMLVFGYDPIWGYEELFYSAFGNIKSIGEIFRAMAPLVFTALGFAVASRAGFFNVGLSGQAYVGWVFAGWFALANPDLPRPVLILGTVLIAMLAGGIAGAIPGILRAYLGTSEVIVTIMMNYILLYSCNYIIRDVFADSLMKNTDSTVNVSANASYQTEWLRALT
ncbi:ABC transporter permease, partial [Streptococcus suis]